MIHVLPTCDEALGGPLRVARSLAAELNRRHATSAEVFPTSPTHTAGPRFGYLPTMRAARELAAKIHDADIVHVHGLWTIPGLFACGSARRRAKPYIITPHGMLDPWSLRQRSAKKLIYLALFEKRNLRCAARVHFLNDGERDAAPPLGFEGRTFVLPNGVSVEQFDDLPPREAAKAQLGLHNEDVHCLLLGRIHPSKGFDLLVPALGRAIRDQPRLRLIIAGPDEAGYRRKVELLAASHGVLDRTRFTGLVTGEMKRLVLAAADFLVAPSHQEADSISVKEAMACALPVLLSPAHRCDEVISEGAGLRVSETVESVAAGLLKLGSEAGRRAEMGRRGRALVTARYSWSVITDQLIEVYSAAADR